MQPASSATQPDLTFAVGVDAIVVGDDGRNGMLAASLRYVSRLAKTFSHVLDLGELTHLETTGSRTVIVEVAWDVAGDSRLRGQVITSPRPTPVTNAAAASSVDEVVNDCLAQLESCDSVDWVALFRRDLTPLHTEKIPAGATLGQVGLRALGILGGIDSELRETCVWLGYQRGTLVVVPVGAHCLMLSVDTDRLDAGALLSLVVEAQARLAALDLANASATPRPRRKPSQPEAVPVGPPQQVGVHKLRRPQLSLSLHR